MTTSQPFAELAVLTISIMVGRIATELAQIGSPDWAEKITGPLGALVSMGFGIWWLKNRTEKQEAIAEKIRQEQAAKDAKTTDEQKQLIASITEVLISTKNVVGNNSDLLCKVLEKLEK